MALTRVFLKGLGLTDEQVSAIIEEHVNVTNNLKDTINKYKDDAEKLPGVQQELSDLKNDVKKNNWQKKYEDEHSAFEKYKTDIAEKETAEKVKSAYKKLLGECKVGEKHIGSILRVTDFSGMKLTEDGSLDGADKLKEQIGSDWGGFITTKESKPNDDPANPPEDNNGGNGGKTGRAAELAAKYHEGLYGKAKED